MSVYQELEVYTAVDVRDAIVEARTASDIPESEWAVVKSLTADFGKWFENLGSKTDLPAKSGYGKWVEGEPVWILMKDHNGSTLAYASVLLANRDYMSISPGQVQDVYISEELNKLEIIPKLRSAIDDLLWFHKGKRRS